MTKLKVFFPVLKVFFLSLILTILMVAPAQAGVEFVTPVGNCNHVDEIGDGKDLFIIAGQNVQFKVFGNSVDLSDPTSGFRMVPPSGTSNIRAGIVSQGTDCGGTGFALVEVDSPVNLAANARRTLFFKMPLGDESRLKMTIKSFPAINATWNTQHVVNCIVKTGTLQTLNQERRLRIQLPPGHQQDQTNCNQRTLFARVNPSDIGELDIDKPFRYTLTGLPTFITSNQINPQGAADLQQINFPINVAGIRALNATSNSIITIRSLNPNRTRTLNLDVVPNLANGFTEAANCRNLQTGDTVNVDDLVDCELNLAAPPTAGQLITFEVQDRLCVEAGSPDVSYASGSGIGTYIASGTGTIFQVPLRTLSGATSVNTPCASETGVQHTVKFWIGERDTANPDAIDTFRIRTLE